MQTKKGFKLRQVCGENIIVAEGKENIDFTNIIGMNESSAYLWRNVQDGRPFTAEDLARLLCDEYDVDEATALADARTVAKQWVSAGIADEE